jgi:hypothetical protein
MLGRPPRHLRARGKIDVGSGFSTVCSDRNMTRTSWVRMGFEIFFWDVSRHRTCDIRHPPSHTKNRKSRSGPGQNWNRPIPGSGQSTAPFPAPARAPPPHATRTARLTMLASGLPSRHAPPQSTFHIYMHPATGLSSRRAPPPPVSPPDAPSRHRLPSSACRPPARFPASHYTSTVVVLRPAANFPTPPHACPI